MKVRTRFAPSPTGYLHIGGVRTALFAYLTAKASGGEFVLRIEDTDKTREVKGSEQHIFSSLNWLGLEWDEGPDKGGPHGPYRQSERLNLYRKWAEKLISAGRAYADPYTASELQALRQEAIKQKRPFLFRDHRPESTVTWDGTKPLRFKSEPKPYKWEDEVMGELATGPEAIDDFIIIKPDGFPTYNFAHVVDDHLMQISHVIRSQEFLPSVPKYLNLYEALEIPRPKLATLPYVMGPDGKKKLSKRDGAKDLLDYHRDGYLPEALLNYLATLGWNDGTEQEIFSLPELLSKFGLSRVQRSGARFDQRRLNWINGHYIRQKKPEELFTLSENFWPSEARGAEPAFKKQILGLVQERLKFLAELPALSRFFFAEPKESDVARLFAKQLKNIAEHERINMLQASFSSLEGSDFSFDDIKNRLNELLNELNTRPAVLFSVIRIAVSGEEASPELFGTLHVLGKEKSLARLSKAMKKGDSN